MKYTFKFTKNEANIMLEAFDALYNIYNSIKGQAHSNPDKWPRDYNKLLEDIKEVSTRFLEQVMTETW